MLMTFGCAGWTINGIPADKFRNAEPKEYAQLAGGVATTFLVHWLGHVVYFEANNIKWKQDGLCEVHDNGSLSNSQKQMSGRAGFLGQLLVGTALKFSPWNDSMFVTGYHIGTNIEVIGYPLSRPYGDFKTIDEAGGNAVAEYGVYSIWSLLLLEPDVIKNNQKGDCYDNGKKE